MSTRYTCDVCGFSRNNQPLGSVLGEDAASTTVWQIAICGSTDCLVTAITKMHEPQGIKSLRIFRPTEPVRSESNGG